MNTPLNDARLSVEKAREALRSGNRTEARQWAEHAASLAPQMEDPWLILAAVASPHASVEYIKTALKINPNSERARRGMEWAMQRLKENPPPQEVTQRTAPAQSATLRTEGASTGPERNVTKPTSKRNILFPAVLVILGLLICAAAAWSATSWPALAYYMNSSSAAPISHPQVWAQANIPKPTYTPSSLAEAQATPTPQLIAQATIQPTEVAVDLPTNTPAPTIQPNVELPTATSLPPQNTESAPMPTPTYSGSISMSIVPDTPTAEGGANVPLPTSNAASTTETPPLVETSGQRWIDVNLTQQMTYAYQGDAVVKSFLVSTGTWQYPTVTGQYHIYVKLISTDMSGPGYYLPNVPYTMYFYEGYGLHGTYWHHNFGTPMSHGCVNLTIPDAQWLYNWASVGTLVNVHY